jgi:REP element-mobilizing transposase RayT
MSRPLRHVPRPGCIFEVTVRTVQARFLLRPSVALNEMVLGVLGRAQRLYGVEICSFCFASNHFHLLAKVNDAKQLAGFMGYFNSSLAREVCRLVDWKDKVWARRYRAIVISDEPEAQRQRLRYVLAHGVKEFLVEKVRDWPGMHAGRALLEDEPLEGLWFDRTQEYGARRRGEEYERDRFATRETIVLSPLPCWEHLSPEERKGKIAELVREIEAEAAEQRQATGKSVLGRVAILKQHPHERPMRSKRSYAPLVHAASQKVRRDLYDGYRAFVAAFREAAEKLKAGNLAVVFPAGSFPPALPFVGG